MISEYSGKEKYASKAEQQKHESKETSKKETSEQPPKKKILLGKKKEEPKSRDGYSMETERAYMSEVRDQMKRKQQDDENWKKTPVGLMVEGKKAENKGNMKEARRLYDAAKRAGLTLKSQ
jgi:hypothetical protein